MLKIYNTLPDELKKKYTRNVMGVFEYNIDKKILLDPFVKRMIQEVDKSEVLAPNNIIFANIWFDVP